MSRSIVPRLDAATYKEANRPRPACIRLEKVDLFNLLCVLPDARGGDVSDDVYQEALGYRETPGDADRRSQKAAWATVSLAQSGRRA